MNNIIIINGPNLNLLGEREQSQYGSITFEHLKKKCTDHSKKIGINAAFFQSNLEGEIVNKIQDSIKSYDGIIINAAGYTHTSVSIRDALDVFKKPIIELQTIERKAPNTPVPEQSTQKIRWPFAVL